MISIVLPTHADGAALLRRTLHSYESQTTGREAFKVVVADDGGMHFGVGQAAAGGRSFAARHVVSPRARGADIAHKNHARNAGWQAAVGPVCFICDADCL